jgi:pimeloyl-ACP methyl ester carboxylesterase
VIRPLQISKELSMSLFASVTPNLPRRSFLGSAAVGVAASQFFTGISAFAQPAASQPAANTRRASAQKRLEPLKSIDAGSLNVGYFEAGPANGPPVILLHGWPYDIHTYVDVAPMLAAAGYRVIVPHLRGYGTTRFLSSDTPRNGQQAVVAVDIVALMDALKIDKATVAGCDWGARTACIMAALWPARVNGLVSVSGYLIGSQEAGKAPLPPAGRAAVVVPVLLRDRTRPRGLRKEPARLRQADLADRIAEVGLRRRHLRAQRAGAGQPRPGEHRDPQLPLAPRPGGGGAEVRRARSAAGQGAGHHGADDHARRRCQRRAAPRAGAYAKKFSGPYAHRLVKGGIGHNLPQEAPEAFAAAVADVAHL